ncbi:MAG TPA: thymidylate synthase [Chthoniobacterales bacterium]|nr:thymidylate synthase [Chthoniobacterales bacterium]
MHFSEKTIDDLLRSAFRKLLKSKSNLKATRGSMTELTGVLFELRNPRARLSRTETKGRLFSCLGELLWYLAGTDDLSFIQHYLSHYAEESDDGQTVYGAYGPRLFSMKGNDQIANVVKLLKERRTSRRAVIQLFDAADIAEHHKGIPCTCTLQLMIRGDRLIMFTNMRSNDVFIGLPYDVFAFTMLQEILARTLAVEIGTYKHAVGSLHLYEKDRKAAQQYLDEGWQETVSMPPMPLGDPWPALRTLLKAESKIRQGEISDVAGLRLDNYWADLVRLLQIYRYRKDKNTGEITKLRKNLSSQIYDTYVRGKLSAKK